MFRERLICDGSLEAGSDGFRIRLRLPWYRGLPMSCIADVQLTVDGAEFAPSDISVEIDGTRVALADVAAVSDKSWYVLDDATLIVDRPLPKSADGASHEVSVALGIRIPYLPVNDVPLVITERATSLMNVTAVAA